MTKPKLCPPGRVKKYRALRQPRCNAGAGCRRCWDKWDATRRKAVNVLG